MPSPETGFDAFWEDLRSRHPELDKELVVVSESDLQSLLWKSHDHGANTRKEEMTSELVTTEEQRDNFVADQMSGSALLPTHLRKKKVDGAWVDREPEDIVRTCYCLIQAARAWDMEPMALAMASYDVNGKVDYEGQVYTALANMRAGLRAPLNVTYEYGMGTDQPPTSAKIFGTLQCEVEPRFVEVFTVRAMKTANTENWENDPEQQLFYYGCKRWVKRHAPEISFQIETNPHPVPLSPSGFSQPAPEELPAQDVPKITEETGSVTMSGKLRGYMHEISKCESASELMQVRRLLDADVNLDPEDRKRIEKAGKKKYDRLEMLSKGEHPEEEETADAQS